MFDCQFRTQGTVCIVRISCIRCNFQLTHDLQQIGKPKRNCKIDLVGLRCILYIYIHIYIYVCRQIGV